MYSSLDATADAHDPIVKTTFTSGARIEPARTKMAVGGEGVRQLGPEIVRDPNEDQAAEVYREPVEHCAILPVTRYVPRA